MKLLRALVSTSCALATLAIFKSRASSADSSSTAHADRSSVSSTAATSNATETLRTTFQPKLPVIPERRFNIKNYGAVGDGIATETAAIQAAVDAARAVGGGHVEVPAGIFLSGPIHLANHINLHLDAGASLRMLM